MYKATEVFTIKLDGDKETREVYLNGKRLDPAKSLKIRNHSPDGFNWGYGGSGPAQLALAICIELYGNKHAQKIYQNFKFRYIATLPQTDFEKEIVIEPFKV